MLVKRCRNVFFFFFFSSRRRHTRFSRDWSSDVCSSDLGGGRVPGVGRGVPWGGFDLCQGGGARAGGTQIGCPWAQPHSAAVAASPPASKAAKCRVAAGALPCLAAVRALV